MKHIKTIISDAAESEPKNVWAELFKAVAAKKAKEREADKWLSPADLKKHCPF